MKTYRSRSRGSARVARRVAQEVARPAVRRPDDVRVAQTSGGSLERARRLGHRLTPDWVQRSVDLSGADATENSAYMVLPDAAETLYGQMGARAPSPEGLYTRTTEEDENDPEVEYHAWTPNVRLLSNAELALAKGVGLSGEAVEAMRLDIEGNPDLTADRLPDLGLIGKNDCGFFATALQHLIVESGEIGLDDEEQERTLDVSERGEEADEMVDVGWRMVHQFQDSEDFERHAATVVAKDPPSMVTLEGHVGQDLQHPKFHVREGATGFAADNLRDLDDPTLGHRVSLRRPSEERATGQAALPDNYEREELWGYSLGSKEGILLQQVDRAVRELVLDPGWADKAETLTLDGWQWNQTPKTIRAMRARLNGGGGTLRWVLGQVRGLAIDALRSAPLIGERHPATTQAYQALARLSRQPDQVPDLLRDLRDARAAL